MESSEVILQVNQINVLDENRYVIQALVDEKPVEFTYTVEIDGAIRAIRSDGPISPLLDSAADAIAQFQRDFWLVATGKVLKFPLVYAAKRR